MAKYIVTHKGAAHRDDFLSVCIALYVYGLMPVFRRDAEETELDDKDVIILDTGERHEPELMNFDHHQFARDAAPECALSLFIRFLGLEEAFNLKSWYRLTVVLDSKGPMVAAKELGLAKLPIELLSPVEGALLGLFGKAEALSKMDCEAMQLIGRQLVENAKEDLATYSQIREIVQIHEAFELKVFVCDREMSQPLAASMNRYRDLEHPDAAISLTRSDRDGESWTLYRYDDHPKVHFAKLAKNDQVVFAHPGGFIAKLKPGVELDEALLLMESCIIW